jgi:uncharacterized damage-inducible protein DinB
MDMGDREILEHFARTREKTIGLLERVPDEWLSRKADGEDMTLGWLFMHIANGPDWWMQHCMQDGKGWQYQGDGPFDRTSIQNGLVASCDRVLAFFETEGGESMGEEFELVPEKTVGKGKWIGRNRILYLADHEVHHRGKIVLSLRQWGMREFPFMPF